ncbi:hypothetical protein LY76DRAFT_305235 [Colletotrichum caudatum]|nr:hypothetical protein LY76DRAFT_305235 [Colletotrichum caudatum]
MELLRPHQDDVGSTTGKQVGVNRGLRRKRWRKRCGERDREREREREREGVLNQTRLGLGTDRQGDKALASTGNVTLHPGDDRRLE